MLCQGVLIFEPLKLFLKAFLGRGNVDGRAGGAAKASLAEAGNLPLTPPAPPRGGNIKACPEMIQCSSETTEVWLPGEKYL